MGNDYRRNANTDWIFYIKREPDLLRIPNEIFTDEMTRCLEFSSIVLGRRRK